MAINPKFPYPLYLVLSEKDCIHMPMQDVAREAILGGVDIIQYRAKKLTPDAIYFNALRLKMLCDKHGIPLIINDHVSIAKDLGAWGVHVGRSDMAPMAVRDLVGDKIKIGWSLESLDQLNDPQISVVDHLGVSPIYKTKTKTNTVIEWGLEGLQQIRQLTDLPLIAIGNMNMDTAAATYKAGADSIAVVSAICSSPNPREAAESLKALLI